ncbi:MAG: hypothetical protein H7832_15270 [Magnetococcus sp. DMHC-6]
MSSNFYNKKSWYCGGLTALGVMFMVQTGYCETLYDFQTSGILPTNGSYSIKYANPVEYWWEKNPSQTGSWDYFTPMPNMKEPIPVIKRVVKTEQKSP